METNALAAVKRLKSNEFAQWCKPDADVTDSSACIASTRLRKEFVSLNIAPSFKISRDDRFYAMGSCFARNIERVLARTGFEITSYGGELFSDSYRERDRGRRLNLYSTGAILNHVRWGLGVGEPFSQKHLLDVGRGRFMDPYTRIGVLSRSVDELLHERARLTEIASRISTCNVVVITLGLIEIWFDKALGLTLTRPPPRRSMEAEPGRFVFRTSSYEENLSNLDAVYDLLSEHGPRDLRIVVSVSPVPLICTFTGSDVIAANCHSKSVLRVVAETWSSKHSNVDYFPSYEMVTLTNPERAYREDRRHVDPAMVRHIMETFLRSYSREEDMMPTDRWHIPTDSKHRVLVWPDFSNPHELETLVSEYLAPFAKHTGITFCIRDDPATPPPSSARDLLAEGLRKHAGLEGTDTGLGNVHFLDAGMSQADWRFLGPSVDRIIVLPSSEEGPRADFVEKVGVPIIKAPTELQSWSEDTTEN